MNKTIEKIITTINKHYLNHDTEDLAGYITDIQDHFAVDKETMFLALSDERCLVRNINFYAQFLTDDWEVK
jgi:hypothetical protein